MLIFHITLSLPQTIFYNTENKLLVITLHAMQDKLSEHAFLMLQAVRVQNKGLQLRSISELCNCPGTQTHTLD